MRPASRSESSREGRPPREGPARRSAAVRFFGLRISILRRVRILGRRGVGVSLLRPVLVRLLRRVLVLRLRRVLVLRLDIAGRRAIVRGRRAVIPGSRRVPRREGVGDHEGSRDERRGGGGNAPAEAVPVMAVVSVVSVATVIVRRR